MQQAILLFDLGGVLVDLGDPVAAMGLNMSNESFWKLWLSSPIVQQFETGRLEADDFVARFSMELGVSDVGEFDQRFRAWQLPMFDGAEQYLQSLTGPTDIALLSNTNAIHWQHVQSQTDAFSDFAKLFLSFETGNVKPQAAAFLDVVEHFSCTPEDIVFLDDNANNVAAAKAAGLQSKQVKGLAEVKRAVDEFFA